MNSHNRTSDVEEWLRWDHRGWLNLDDEVRWSQLGLALGLWGKSGDAGTWLPLALHLHDTGEVMGYLWDQWLCPSMRRTLSSPFGCEDVARSYGIFLGRAHDIGKATPFFQYQLFRREDDDQEVPSWVPAKAGFGIPHGYALEAITHPVAGQAIVEQALRKFATRIPPRRSVASPIGAHHGTIPDRQRLDDALHGRAQLGWSRDVDRNTSWEDAQSQLMGWALQPMGGNPLACIRGTLIPAAVTELWTGLLVMADWIASDEDLFSLVSLPDATDVIQSTSRIIAEALPGRFERAWTLLQLTPAWRAPADSPLDVATVLCARFPLSIGDKPRPLQRLVVGDARLMAQPGLMAVEAPMGEGKTEAALAAAEVLATRFGLGGVCLALPTMATTDAMFDRVRPWVDALPVEGAAGRKSLCLAHGKAALNEAYQGLLHGAVQKADSSSTLSSIGAHDLGDKAATAQHATACEWMRGRKRGMLSNFVVCTVDQVLMGALLMRHASLRQLALASKVIVIDEVHAYDEYMLRYLARAIEWLAFWGCPVILLSATLPPGRRELLVASYQRGARARPANTGGAVAPSSHDDMPGGAYPRVTMATAEHSSVTYCSSALTPRHVKVVQIDDDVRALSGLLTDLLRDGGCAGVVCDTVARAQEAFDALSGHFPGTELILAHSRFIDLDRAALDARLVRLLGRDATVEAGTRPRRLVVVGTQVLEQSLDIDFDVLVTDVAPVDLVFQRLGRTHRHSVHDQSRPTSLENPVCYLRGITSCDSSGPTFARGLANVYDTAALLETLSLLGACQDAGPTEVTLPDDIPRLVALAYSGTCPMPQAWQAAYERATTERTTRQADKRTRADTFCLPPVAGYGGDRMGTLDGLARGISVRPGSLEDQDQAGSRAVRDSEESVEVLLGVRRGRGVGLLPWVGDSRHGVEPGAVAPEGIEPSPAWSRVMSQCSVRLPYALCRPQVIEPLISALEDVARPFVAAWQDSPWLAGQLVLPLEGRMDGTYCMPLHIRVGDGAQEWVVSYSRTRGLSARLS